MNDCSLINSEWTVTPRCVRRIQLVQQYFTWKTDLKEQENETKIIAMFWVVTTSLSLCFLYLINLLWTIACMCLWFIDDIQSDLQTFLGLENAHLMKWEQKLSYIKIPYIGITSVLHLWEHVPHKVSDTGLGLVLPPSLPEPHKWRPESKAGTIGELALGTFLAFAEMRKLLNSWILILH